MLRAVEALHHRIFQGKSTAVLGASFVALPFKLGATVVRISCDVPRETFGPLLALVQRIHFLMGDSDPLLANAKQQVFELGRRVLGDAAGAKSTLGQVVHEANRLAKGPACIVFDAVDAADDATLEALLQILDRPGWLKVPLVLGFKSAEPSGLSNELLQAVTKAEGEEGTLHAPAPPPPASFSPSLLPPETRFVLRAASVVGPAFELSLLCELVGQEPMDVLRHLQIARDLGLPLEDRGDGTFALDSGQAHMLRAGLLPTLRAVLHRRAAELLSPSREEDAPLPEEPALFDTARVEKKTEGAAAEPSAAVESPAPDPQPPAPTRAPEVKAPAAKPSQTDNPARASEHLFESGDFALAAERALLAAMKAAGLGAHAQAEAFARRALEAAIGLPDSEAGRRLRTRALIQLGRLRLEGYAPTATFDLSSALQPLEAAKRSLSNEDAPDQHVELAQLLAAVHCERGDAESLDKALAELAETSRALLDRGHALEAARLLNDQAAVYMKMGDPVRAFSLLDQSREVFEKRGQRDAITAREVAETDHLIARVPLHVRARTGHEDDALSRALDHAMAARRTYERLGDTFSSGRVLETMGRLELKRGRVDKALQHFQQALETQQKIADLVGLARTTAGLSDALVGAERLDEALALLSDSVALNHQKGSVVGVAYNRRAFEELSRAMAPQQVIPIAEEVRARLKEAEAELGKISLPGESS